jgi:hypothetical protein
MAMLRIGKTERIDTLKVYLRLEAAAGVGSASFIVSPKAKRQRII